MTLLTAGHETTATGLAWAFERLLRTPHALERLHRLARRRRLPRRRGQGDAARAAGDRRRGAQAHPRRPRSPAGGCPPGRSCCRRSPCCTCGRTSTRRRRSSGPSGCSTAAPESYAWIPFGGGVRRCIGASFAQVEMRTVLREVLRRVRLRAPRSRPERGVIRHVTVVPGRGARALVDRAPSRRAGGGTRRRPRRHAPASRTRRARSPSDVTTDSSPGAGSASTSAAMSSSAALRPAPGGEHDADAVALELERLARRTPPSRRLPRASANSPSSADQPAHRARAVAPPAGRPRSDHVHAVDDPAGHCRRRRNSRIAPDEQQPRAELQGQPHARRSRRSSRWRSRRT